MGCFGFIGGWIVGAIGDWPFWDYIFNSGAAYGNSLGMVALFCCGAAEGNSLSLAPAARDSTRPTRPPRGSLLLYRRDSVAWKITIRLGKMFLLHESTGTRLPREGAAERLRELPSTAPGQKCCNHPIPTPRSGNHRSPLRIIAVALRPGATLLTPPVIGTPLAGTLRPGATPSVSRLRREPAPSRGSLGVVLPG